MPKKHQKAQSASLLFKGMRFNVMPSHSYFHLSDKQLICHSRPTQGHPVREFAAHIPARAKPPDQKRTAEFMSFLLHWAYPRPVSHSFTRSRALTALEPLMDSPSRTVALDSIFSMVLMVLEKPLPPEVTNGTMVLPDRSTSSKKLYIAIGMSPHQLGNPKKITS